jgi:VRR-NUC domain
MRTDVQVERRLAMGIRNRETDLVRAVLDWLSLRRIKAWRTNNTSIFDPIKKVYRTFQGLRGVSDILGILPQTVDLQGQQVTFGNFLAIEVKRPGEALREDQEVFLQEIRERGGIGLCVRSLADLEREMQSFPIG